MKKEKIKIEKLTIGGTIPTMQYGNIVVSLEMSGGTLEELTEKGETYVKNLYKEYTGVSLGKEPQKVDISGGNMEKVALLQEKTEAYRKAENMLKAATGKETISLIKSKIKVSKKLTDEEKQSLL